MEDFKLRHSLCFSPILYSSTSKALLCRFARAMLQVQIHPTGLVNPSDPNNPSKMLAPEAMRGSGGVLLNGGGHRFCNELNTRANVTAAIMANCGPAAGSDSKVAFLVSCGGWAYLALAGVLWGRVQADDTSGSALFSAHSAALHGKWANASFE